MNCAVHRGVRPKSTSPVPQLCVRRPTRKARGHRRRAADPVNSDIPNRPQSALLYVLTLGLAGFIAGPLLDGIHSRVGLQTYDVLAFEIGGLKSSLLVPPLLAVFYLVLGYLQSAGDALVADGSTRAAYDRANGPLVLLSTGALAVILATSAFLYDSDVPYWQTFSVLGALALVNWKLFDGTKHGLALAALCGLGAPASEVLLNSIFHLWHYSRADLLFGASEMVSWVPWCYFSYVPAVANLSRASWKGWASKRVDE